MVWGEWEAKQTDILGEGYGWLLLQALLSPDVHSKPVATQSSYLNNLLSQPSPAAKMYLEYANDMRAFQLDFSVRIFYLQFTQAVRGPPVFTSDLQMMHL